MPPRQKEFLYKDRIFGDDETPPRIVPSKKPFAGYDPTKPSWYKLEDGLEYPATSQTSLQNDNSVYPFKHDLLSSARLNLQHHLFTSTTGFLLHPAIPLRNGTLIADIGCGTGIWSLELSRTLPAGAKVEAFDLDTSQTPPNNFCPPGLLFQQLDIFSPLPKNMVGRYDVVNIRLFMCVISTGDPLPLLRQLMKLLKPGGYLQWQEYDSTTDKLVLADPSLSAPKLKALRDHIRRPGLQVGTWVRDLHTRFGEANGELVRHERHWTPKNCVIVKQDVSFLAGREWAAKLEGSEEGRELKRFTLEAEEECWQLSRGAFVDSEIVTWVVRKAWQNERGEQQVRSLIVGV